MYDRKFFRSKLGRASLFSIAAMLAMNIVALQDPGSVPPSSSTAVEPA
jgi:hypothetical protein